jgi:hypothetical protein
MVSSAPLLGTTPTPVERLAALERVVAEQAEAIAAYEVRITALEDQIAHQEEDGPAPVRLPSSWHPVKAAAPLAGFSESGLRKRIDRAQLDGEQGPWWQYLGGRLFIDLDHCPRRAVRT